MPTGVSLFVWLPEERAKWVEVRAKHEYWCAILGLSQRISADTTTSTDFCRSAILIPVP
jgi:hypothetical protein